MILKLTLAPELVPTRRPRNVAEGAFWDAATGTRLDAIETRLARLLHVEGRRDCRRGGQAVAHLSPEPSSAPRCPSSIRARHRCLSLGSGRRLPPDRARR